MNKVMLLGRLTKDPEIRYSTGAEPVCVAKYTLAVNKRFKREGEPDAEFINCVAFGKTGEFAEKFLKKGRQILAVGRLQVRSYDKDGQKHWITEVVIEEHYFADSKPQGEASSSGSADPLNYYTQNPPKQDKRNSEESFYTIEEPIDDSGLPF